MIRLVGLSSFVLILNCCHALNCTDMTTPRHDRRDSPLDAALEVWHAAAGCGGGEAARLRRWPALRCLLTASRPALLPFLFTVRPSNQPSPCPPRPRPPTQAKERNTDEGSQEGLDDVFQEVGNHVEGEGRHTGQHPCPCTWH